MGEKEALLSGEGCLSSLLRLAHSTLVIFQKLVIETHLVSHFLYGRTA